MIYYAWIYLYFMGSMAAVQKNCSMYLFIL